MASVLTVGGRAMISGRMFGATPSQLEPKFIGWGTGAGTAVAADTTLFTESAETRTTGTASQQTTTSTNDTHRCVGTLTASAGRSITNVGLLDAVTVGQLYIHSDFTAVVLATGESIAFTIDNKFA